MGQLEMVQQEGEDIKSGVAKVRFARVMEKPWKSHGIFIKIGKGHGKVKDFWNWSIKLWNLTNRSFTLINQRCQAPAFQSNVAWKSIKRSWNFVVEISWQLWKGAMTCQLPEWWPILYFRRYNIMDNMLKMMEKYANNLEELVADKTKQLTEEKKKTDLLLYRMLPG